MTPHILLLFLWIVYCLLHSVLAGFPAKQKAQQLLGSHFRFYRVYYTVFALVTFVAIIIYQLSITPIPLFQSTIATRLTGGVVALCGLVIMGICIKKYFMSLSGLRSLFIQNPSPELMITGIHQYVRHPLYLGTFIFIWGLLIVLPYASLLVSNIVITVYTLFGIGLEEHKLIAEFGNRYRAYKRQVPMIIPSFRKYKAE